MATQRKGKQVKLGSQPAFYASFEEWEAENFPRLTKQKARKQLEGDPEALGAAIADDILQKLDKVLENLAVFRKLS